MECGISYFELRIPCLPLTQLGRQANSLPAQHIAGQAGALRIAEGFERRSKAAQAAVEYLMLLGIIALCTLVWATRFDDTVRTTMEDFMRKAAGVIATTKASVPP